MRHIGYPLLLGVLLLPSISYAAESTFFGPIVPEQCHACPCGFAGVLEIMRHVMNFAVTFGVIVLTVVIAWAGLTYIVSATNPENRRKANGLITGAIIGIVLVLSSWLIIDFVMRTLYSGAEGNAGKFGPWNSILAEDADWCIESKETSPLFGELPFTPEAPEVTPTTPGGTPPAGGGTGTNCPAADPAKMVAFPASATSGGAERATAETVRNFLAMREAALADGINLKVTDGYRPESEQVALWNSRGSGDVAKPCSLGGNGSNHNSGVAIDISIGCSNGQSSCSTAQYKWLKQNGGKWNFRNALPNDPVHWSPSGR